MQKQKKLFYGTLTCLLIITLIYSQGVALGSLNKYDTDESGDLREFSKSDYKDLNIHTTDDFSDVEDEIFQLWDKGDDVSKPDDGDIEDIYVGGVASESIFYGNSTDNYTITTGYYVFMLEFKGTIFDESFAIIASCDITYDIKIVGKRGSIHIDADYLNASDNYYIAESELGVSITRDIIFTHQRAIFYIPVLWFVDDEAPSEESIVIGIFLEKDDKIYGDIYPNSVEQASLLSMNWAGFLEPQNLVLYVILIIIVAGVLIYARKKARS